MSVINTITNKRQRQGYISFDCPQCGGKGKAYKYDTSSWGRCNKASSCGWVQDLSSEKDKKKNLKPIPKRGLDKLKDRTKSTRGSLGQIVSQTEVYLTGRIPGCDVELLAREKLIGVSGLIKEGASRRWDRMNYRLFTPLIEMSTGRVVTGQHRYTGFGSPPLDHNGVMRPKNLSMAGSYGEHGVTFGSLPTVLLRARKMALPTIYITEGDMDFLTMTTIGFDTSVSVPGAMQAKKVGIFLKSKGWRGKIVLCLDNDEAGKKATKEFVDALDLYEHMVVEDASPGLKNHDVTDYNKKFGAEFTCRMLQNGRVIYNNAGLKSEFLEDERVQKVFAEGLWSKKTTQPPVVGKRIKNVIDLTGGKTSPIKKLARSLNCGKIKQAELFYDSSGPHLENFSHKRCQSKWCSHCRSVQWNFAIAPRLMETWPEQLMVGEYAFDDHEDLIRKKRSVLTNFRPPTMMRVHSEENLDHLGQSLCVLINVTTKKMVIIVDPENLDDMTRGIYGFNPVTVSREEALKRFVLPAYVSTVEYTTRRCLDPTYLIHEDPWIYKKMKSVVSRKEMPWPSQEKIREDVSDFFKNVREKEKVESEECPQSEEELRFIVNYTKEDSLTVMSVSDKSFSYKSLSDSLLWQEAIKTNPADPTINYITNSHLCPTSLETVVKDFVELHERVPLDHAKYSIHLRKKKLKRKKLIEMSEKEYEDYVLWLSGEGFIPRFYMDMSFDHPLPGAPKRVPRNPPPI